MFSVIFDMDGTLLDTQRICVPAWEYAGSLQHMQGLGEHIYNVCGMNEDGWTAYLEQNCPGLDIPEFKAAAGRYIIQNGTLCFKPGAEKLLSFLKENGVKMAIASGSSVKLVLHNLKELGISDYFGAIAAGQEVEKGKPAPDVFLLAAERLGVKPEDCFVFEDSANGIRAGHAAGMRCIGVPDLVDFDSETKALMYAQIGELSEAIGLFESLLHS